MCETIASLNSDVELYFPRQEEYRIFDLSRETRIIRKEVATSGTLCHAQLTPALLSKWKEWLVK
jgi:GTP-binding protein HflX